MSASPEFVPPRVVGTKYAVSGVLSRDRRGVRLSGEHTSIGRAVEILILDAAATPDGPEAAWLMKQARTLGAANHPGLQSLLDSGTDRDGKPYLVFEAPSGDTVTGLIAREGPLPPDRAGRIMLGVLEALRALHKARVVARGLSPESVVISRRGEGDIVKLRHLGAAAALSDEAPDAVPFSPWVAPEVRRGEPGTHVSVDVYSAGAMLRHLITGHPTGGRMPLEEFPDTVRRALLRSVCDPPDERFPSIDVFMQAIALLVPSDVRPARDEMPLPEDPLVADLHYLLLRRNTKHGTRAEGPQGEARAHLMPVLLTIESVYRLLGQEKWAELAETVPEVDTLLPGSGNTPLHMASGVPVATLAKVLSAADDLGGAGDLGLIPVIAEHVAQRGLHRAFPALPARLDAESLIEGFPYLWSQVQWQGTPVVADREPRSARLSVRYQTEPQLEVTGYVAALLRAALKMVGATSAQVSITAAEALGDQADVFRVRW